ncbi:replication-relaxation family protein [Actinoplanes sp. NPDC049668]|uniref:replication-relaxation family protein n=1 Tax=unclassified Actinoplanes TaxID=2626549 RepID=UPI0033BF72D0
MSANHNPGPEPQPRKSSSSSSSSRQPSSGRLQRLDLLRRLTARDHRLLSWLAEHYVLTTSQIATALFPSLRTARLRLAALTSMQAVTRFADLTTGSQQYLYTLGPLGAVPYPTQFNDPLRPDARDPRSNVERTERIIGSRKLGHLIGTNQLFVDLHAYTRTDPNARLARWWSEQHATAVYGAVPSANSDGPGIRPDGHGVWEAGGRQIGFFLEHDNGTEKLVTVVRKLEAYTRLVINGGPRYPVLLRVPGRRRERHLLEVLAGARLAMPVATGIHTEHPAGPVWTLTHDPPSRRWLHELPSDHGPDSPATNPHRFPDDLDEQ